DWRSGTNKIIFPLSDECPENGYGCNSADDSAIDQAIQAAKNNDVTVYPIWGSGASNGVTSRMEQLADETGGKAQSKGSASNIVGAASSGNSFKIGADTTCTLPSTTEYSGTVDLVFVADTSASYGKEWNTICSSVQNTIDKLEKKGLDANVSIYMATPDADEVGDGNFSGNDKGTLMFSGFDYVPSKMDSDGYNLPSCMPDQSDPSSDDVFAYKSWYGYGVTTWDGTNLDKYRPSVDHGLEAWGVAAKWVFEHHTFRSDTDRRFMFIFGDTYPTGAGGNPGHFREEGEYSQHQLDSDPEIVQNVTAWANKKDVTVHTFVGTSTSGTGWEGNVNSHTSYGGPMGDAKELMKDLAKNTGGQFHKYQDVQNIPDKIKELFKSIQTVSGGSCKNRFQFGEMKGSTGNSLRNSLTLSYPVSIWQNEDLQTPGTLRIELRDGDLETLAGAINRVIRRGNRRGEQINATLRYVNERRIFTDPDHQVERPTTTTYHLENPSGSGITYDDQLIIGVNGQMQVNLTSSGQTTINNVESKTSFKAYRGASVQVIGVNRKADSLHIDPLQIVCQTGCSGGPQQLIQNARDATKGDGVYEPKFKGIGAFYHNFTTVNIGPTSATEKPALCIATDTSPHCVTLRATAINTIELGPGSHLLKIQYRPSSDRVVISE
ncbi:MAG: hypothetical protein SVU32_09770, partial [Candidatus Nanohaloarchaea archaeon]|nr:hypothetical protein [Candidatus Nanohaloarchaea archaeon]